MARRSSRRPSSRALARQNRAALQSSSCESRVTSTQREQERTSAMFDQFESAHPNADRWIARIEAGETALELLRPPLPDRFALSAMAGRARALVEQRSALAEAIAEALLEFAQVVPGSSRFPDELPPSAWLILAAVRRGRGELDEAEDLCRRIRTFYAGDQPDPHAAAQLFEEEADLLAARGRHREAILRARQALPEYSDPNLWPQLRTDLLRKIAHWAKAAEAPDPSSSRH